MGKLPANTRWHIAWALFLSTAVNYLNRQTFSVLSPVIAAQFHLSHLQLGKIMGVFQIAYSLAWLFGGIFLDVVGTRIGLVIAATLWSLVNMATSLANSAFAFSALRFLLGIGEGLNWPGASKAVAEWFPDKERSVAVAIFDSGSSVGGALAALTVPWIALTLGWRMAFLYSGICGLLWIVLWLRVYPADRCRDSSGSQTSRPCQELEKEEPWTKRWCMLARNPNLWAIVLGRSLTDPIWWFYVFWLPQYLSDVRGFSLKGIAAFAWLPFVCADLGNFTGGGLSSFCVGRGIPVVRARLLVCFLSCVPILAGIPAAFVGKTYLSLGLICIALWGYASWATMGLTLPSDLFQPGVVATVTGISGALAGLNGAVFSVAVGMWADHSSYKPAFVVAGLAPLAATLIVSVLIRPAAAVRSTHF